MNDKSMIRIFLILQIIGFMAAALMHFGVFIKGYEHEKARIAETVISIVLLIGLVITFINPGNLRKVSLIVQGFALFGTLVGLFTIIIGIGPQSSIDLIFHTFFITILVLGLILTKKLS